MGTKNKYDEENNIKSIFTRGGSTITFNELDNSILVKDPSGNTWFMDGAGNISVTAPNDITITAGANISITAGQNINTSAGINISESAGVNKTESVGVLKTLTVGTDYITNVMGKMVEYIMGNKESRIEKDRQRIVNGASTIHSEKSNNFHSQEEIQHNSAGLAPY